MLYKKKSACNSQFRIDVAQWSLQRCWLSIFPLPQFSEYNLKLCHLTLTVTGQLQALHPLENCKHCRKREGGGNVFPLREESLSLKLPQLPLMSQHVQPRWITGRGDKRMPWLPYSYEDTCPAVHCHTETWVLITNKKSKKKNKKNEGMAVQ